MRKHDVDASLVPRLLHSASAVHADSAKACIGLQTQLPPTPNRAEAQLGSQLSQCFVLSPVTGMWEETVPVCGPASSGLRYDPCGALRGAVDPQNSPAATDLHHGKYPAPAEAG